jgi:hypothetical protein
MSYHDGEADEADITTVNEMVSGDVETNESKTYVGADIISC